MAVKPCKLKSGSSIGIVAPASPYYDESVLAKAIESVKMMSFKVVIGRSVYKRYGYLAGSDYERAEDINSFFLRRDIDGIICLRGGYGSLRILNKINYSTIRRNPKVFIGYSDITAVHIAISKMCNMVTFHGPMLYSDFGNTIDEYSKESFMKAVTSNTPLGEMKNPEEFGNIKVITPGRAKGLVTGGNLSVIVSTIGTSYEIDTQNRILLLEEVGEEPYRVDRMLTQLILCRKLKECAGIVFGQCTDCYPKEPHKSLPLAEVICDRLMPLGIPVLYNVAFGHNKIKMTVPLGVYGTITEDGKFIINEEGVV